MSKDPRTPQVKICGLTRPAEAAACAALGAAAVGCVFFPPSPRHVTFQQARRIFRALPANVSAVGVFVDTPIEQILSAAAYCSFSTVQLHGRENPDVVAHLHARGLTVLKTLFNSGAPPFSAAAAYAAAAYLVECGRGSLPGGNAAAWDWRRARVLSRQHPTVLAGGLAPENVGLALAHAKADAVDVSSGVESAPGRKDPAKVAAFIAAVEGCPATRPIRRIFQ